MKSLTKIIPITADNLGLLVEGAKKFGMERSSAWFKRILFDPTVVDLTSDTCRGHISVTDSGEIVALLAYYYQPCFFKQTKRLGSSGCIMAADHRFGEELLCVIDRNNETQTKAVLGFGNEIATARAAEFNKKAKRMNEPPYRSRLFSAGVADVVAGFVVGWRKVFHGCPVRMQKFFWIISRPLQLFLNWSYLVKMRKSGFSFSQYMSFGDEKFRVFWERFLAANDGVVSSREPRRLSWLFDDALKTGKDILVAAEKDGRIDGYVLLREEHHSTWARSFEVIDVCAVGNDSVCLKGLMTAALFFASKARGMALHFFGHMPNQEQWLDPILKRRRERGWSSFFYRCSDPEICTSLEQNKGWFFGPLDGERCMGYGGYTDV